MKNLERLPKLIVKWADIFGQVSKYNTYPAILAYFNLLGQVLKDDITIMYGFTEEDTRVHVCWIQTARTGKTVLNDFYIEICEQTFKLLNSRDDIEDDYFNIFDTLDITDSAMVGSHHMVTNPLYERNDPDSPKEISEQVDGALSGSGIALFDEFESSGIFNKSAHKENVVVYFQRLMNTLCTNGYLIKKRLALSDEIICDCQRSIWGTTYVPEKLTYVIASKGVLQRMFMYIREVPQDIRDEMRFNLIDALGTIREREHPKLEFAKAIYTIVDEVKRAKEELADGEQLISFVSGVQDLLKVEYKAMRREIKDMTEEQQQVVSLFETNCLLYITKLAVLCAITESPARPQNERFKVFPRNVRQASVIVRQGYTSLASWLETALKVQRHSIAEEIGLNDYISAYNSSYPDEDGLVLKNTLKVKLKELHNISTPKFYRQWPKVKHIFEENKKGKTAYLKLKPKDEWNE